MPKIQIKIKLDKKTANQLVEAIAKEGHDPQAFVARLIGAAAHEVARLADGWAQKQSAELKIEAEKDEKPAKKAKPKKAAQKSDVKTEEKTEAPSEPKLKVLTEPLGEKPAEHADAPKKTPEPAAEAPAPEQTPSEAKAPETEAPKSAADVAQE